jgi:hypothetical protein
MNALKTIENWCKMYCTTSNRYWPGAGSFTVLTDPDDIEGCNFQFNSPDDIVVYYDFNTESMDEQTKNKFIEWLYDRAIPRIMLAAKGEGYSLVEESGTPGNGLYYEALRFKKS